ncbi:molybdate ABC transporter substrate-binding protein [uncultured Mucilaginibacter sp.]|uniref:molybdate ABC transporter substrate-binding protein n=1 Tax=uncultured Mucilaginibacter sp. TaxID=797541 RepID=UPI0025EAB5C9|nr:molybdate ABC transporter substrate-binding protein [uncultured Mucilaginibacter sp.]
MLKNKALLLSIALLSSQFCIAQSLKVAVAANLQSVIKVLDADFAQKTGIVVEPIIGSSGNLANQIKNGAPFDIFLSADMGFPQDLYTSGFAIDKAIVYASGSLIVCSTQNINLKNWQTLILTNNVAKVAVANPAIAPYGKAAIEALAQLGLADKIKTKLVTGESIAQVNTYITTGVVTMGFTSQSLLMDAGQTVKLYWVPVEPKLYAPIEQGMVILKHAKENNLQQAEKFYQYLLSSSAKAIFIQYGYIVKQ